MADKLICFMTTLFQKFNSNITVIERGTAIVVQENKLCLKEIKLLLLLLLSVVVYI